MLFLRIRQAECALGDGRLDEAFDLVRVPGVRNHYNGQRLVGRLIDALLTRGRSHLDAGRCPQALADCTKAEHLGGNLVQIAELKSAAARSLEEKQQADRMRSLAVARAKECLDQGRTSLGEKLLAEAGPDEQAKILLRELAVRRGTAEFAVERVRRALDREDLTAAMEELIKARNGQALTGQLADLAEEALTLADRRVRSFLDQGRLDLAGHLADPLHRLAGDRLEVRELQRILSQCRQAARDSGQGQFQEALRVLRQLSAILPDAAWLKSAVLDAEKAAQGQEALHHGPLGMVLDESGCSQVVETSPMTKTYDTPSLPETFVISVDGVGSFLVVRRSCVTLGPVSSSQRPLIGLMADPSLPAMVIERVDEDYFLRGGPGSGEARLLRDGDAINLGPRCRMRFRHPNAASTSALLQLANARLPHGDVRQVILLDREMILGPGPGAHIRADELPETAVLQVQEGRLVCRTKMPVVVDGQPAQTETCIGPDTHVQIGTISFVVKQYS